MGSRTRRTALVAAVLVALLGGCVDARPEEASCVRAPLDVLGVIATNLTVAGGLRHGSLETRDGYTFITAELARDGDPERLRGRLLTWVTGSIEGGEFFAVDVFARDNSSWPPAPFDVRQPGAIDSRACTGFRAGEPDPSIVRPGAEPDPDADDEPEGDDDPGSVIGF